MPGRRDGQEVAADVAGLGTVDQVEHLAGERVDAGVREVTAGTRRLLLEPAEAAPTVDLEDPARRRVGCVERRQRRDDAFAGRGVGQDEVAEVVVGEVVTVHREEPPLAREQLARRP